MTTTRSTSQPARTGLVPIAPRVARCWPGALAALLVALASWAGAVEVARDAGAPAPLPVSQTLRALARLLRGKAGGEELRAASRRIAPAVAAGRQPSELRWLRAVPPAAREP